MSPVYGQKTVVLSPVYQTSDESRFVIIPVESLTTDKADNDMQNNCRALELQSTADRRAAELARRLREKVKDWWNCILNQHIFIVASCTAKHC